ncbi:MAG: hypothetical protein QME61_01240 [Patescibacteria group bacterium]|nr:hypothetical protein [Patescibacteria group bacterium]
MPEEIEEKKEFLKREEIKTMAKDIARLREAEAQKERERIAALKIEEEKKEEREKIEKKRKEEEKREIEEERKIVKEIRERARRRKKEKIKGLPRPLSPFEKIFIRVILIILLFLIFAFLFTLWYWYFKLR